MNDYQNEFKDFQGHIWLNAASEGPLPNVATKALEESVVWKSLPHQLDIPKFARVPKELKMSIGRLINIPWRDVILGNSASYGLHILANGYPWQKGDEILLMQNDFPSDILPWLALENKGVRVIQISPRNRILQPEELLAHVTERTKLFCISQVHTFSGIMVDVHAMTKICRAHNIISVINLSQSAGAMPVDAKDLNADAIVCAGYKWLLGPYGTGFCWMDPQLREKIEWNHAYWASVLSEQELKSEGALEFKDLRTARQFDMFGTANFFNFVPFRASIDFILSLDISNIYNHNQELVQMLVNGLDRSRFNLISPENGPFRSNLVVISHKDPSQNENIYKQLKDNNIHTALWKNNIRIAPHIYNTSDHIHKFLSF